jgi:hypothetical protein
MGEERWGVDVEVRGFGQTHRLWPKFVELALTHEDRSFKWLVTDTTDSPRDSARIRAIVHAQSADAAIKQLMRVVGIVGHSIDRYGEVAWAEMEGRAYKL